MDAFANECLPEHSCAIMRQSVLQSKQHKETAVGKANDREYCGGKAVGKANDREYCGGTAAGKANDRE
jgi:hypothetical protein